MAETTMDRMARALQRLADVTEAVQNVSIGVTHTANAHQVIGESAAHAARQVERIADAATSAAVGFVALGEAATKAANAVDRLATVAERLGEVKS